jgi:hypothetical protein
VLSVAILISPFKLEFSEGRLPSYSVAHLDYNCNHFLDQFLKLIYEEIGRGFFTPPCLPTVDCHVARKLGSTSCFPIAIDTPNDEVKRSVRYCTGAQPLDRHQPRR